MQAVKNNLFIKKSEKSKNYICDLIINQNKMSRQAEFMSRMFSLSVWLINRYKLNCENVDFDRTRTVDQKKNKKLTIRLIFNIK